MDEHPLNSSSFTHILSSCLVQFTPSTLAFSCTSQISIPSMGDRDEAGRVAGMQDPPSELPPAHVASEVPAASLTQACPD